MIPIPRDAPASIACGRSGRPLLAICPAGHRRLIPFRRLATHAGDGTPLYGRPYRCPACGSREVTLYDVPGQADLDRLVAEILPPRELRAPSRAARRKGD